VDPSRVPPGQYVTKDFPVLSAGPTPQAALDSWEFTIRGAVDEPVSWSWAEFRALPRETFTVDIHCVTKWTKFDTTWSGVSLDTLLAAVGTTACPDVAAGAAGAVGGGASATSSFRRFAVGLPPGTHRVRSFSAPLAIASA